eukprot:4015354-Amphidinium_carterae.1
MAQGSALFRKLYIDDAAAAPVCWRRSVWRCADMQLDHVLDEFDAAVRELNLAMDHVDFHEMQEDPKVAADHGRRAVAHLEAVSTGLVGEGTLQVSQERFQEIQQLVDKEATEGSTSKFLCHHNVVSDARDAFVNMHLGGLAGDRELVVQTVLRGIATCRHLIREVGNTSDLLTMVLDVTFDKRDNSKRYVELGERIARGQYSTVRKALMFNADGSPLYSVA